MASICWIIIIWEVVIVSFVLVIKVFSSNDIFWNRNFLLTRNELDGNIKAINVDEATSLSFKNSFLNGDELSHQLVSNKAIGEAHLILIPIIIEELLSQQ